MTQVHFSMTLAIFYFIITDLSDKIPFFSMSSCPCSTQVFVDVMVEVGGGGHHVMRGHFVGLYSPCHHGAVHALHKCLLMSWWRGVGTPCHEGALCCISFSRAALHAMYWWRSGTVVGFLCHIMSAGGTAAQPLYILLTCRVLMKWNDCGIFIPHHVTTMQHCIPPCTSCLTHYVLRNIVRQWHADECVALHPKEL